MKLTSYVRQIRRKRCDHGCTDAALCDACLLELLRGVEVASKQEMRETIVKVVRTTSAGVN